MFIELVRVPNSVGNRSLIVNDDDWAGIGQCPESSSKTNPATPANKLQSRSILVRMPVAPTRNDRANEPFLTQTRHVT